MHCPRCNGLMARERVITMEGGAVTRPYDAWRCLICGNILDPVILGRRNGMKGRS